MAAPRRRARRARRTRRSPRCSGRTTPSTRPPAWSTCCSGSAPSRRVPAARAGVAAAEPGAHAARPACARCCAGTRRARPAGRCPARLGYWPAALALLAFVWLELVAPDRRDAAGAALVVRLLRARAPARRRSLLGSRWFDRGDGFEVLSSLFGRLSPLGRRDDGVLVRPLAARRARRSCPRRPAWSAQVSCCSAPPRTTGCPGPVVGQHRAELAAARRSRRAPSVWS